MPNFLEAIRARVLELSGDGVGCYLNASEPGAEMPYWILNRLWEEPFLNTSDSYYKEIRMQFTLFTLSDTQSETLGKTVYDGLWPKASNPRLTFSDGYEMTRWPDRFIGPGEEITAFIGDQKVWRSMFDYLFLVGVS